MNTQVEVEQWEALDLGDSELSSFLRPCKRKSPPRSLQTLPPALQNPKPGFNSNTNHHQTLRRCALPDQSLEDSHSRPLIPGPAGTVQVAIRRKMNKDPRSFNEHGEPIPTQEFIRKASEEPDWEDKDFSDDPWVSAVDYIRSEGLLSKGKNAIGTPLSEIKGRCGSWGKVDQVVAIVKTCTPNGLGDVMVTLKDPTGTIDASMHKKVISESEFGRDIRVGAVLILKKVAVCAPSRLSHYLNITLKNISKVITKDTPVLPNQNHSETSAKNPATVNESEENLRGQPKDFPVEQGTMNNLRKNGKESREAFIDVEMEETNSHNLWEKGVTKSQCEVRMDQTPLGKHASSISQAEIDATTRTTSNTREPQLHGDVANGTYTADDFRPSKLMRRSGEQDNVMENPDEATTSGSKVNKSQLIASSSSVPQWTDEQLEELFAFD